METILYHSNILSEQDVPFINEVLDQLDKKKCKLVLTGWNTVLPEWNLKPTYFKLPESLVYFDDIYSEQEINSDFEKYNLSPVFLLERFNWWFSNPINESEKRKRLSFLHFHLHHYLKLIKQYNPSLLLIWNGNDPRQYIISELGEKFGIKRLFIERGPLPSVIFYDIKGVLSNSSVASLDLNKFNNGFDNYSNFENYSNWYHKTSETLWSQPNKSENISLREQLGITKNQKVTLFIGQVDNDIQTRLFSPYFSSNIEAFEWFVTNAIEDSHFVIGKHHPKSLISTKEYQDVIGNISNVIWTDQFPLDECLEVADYIVAVNSSVIFDALLHKKPVFSLGESLLSNKGILYEYSPKEFQDVLNEFYSLSNFKSKLENFKNILELLFRENLFFTKSKLDGAEDRFIQKIIELKQINNNVEDIFEHHTVVENYYKNISTIETAVKKNKSLKKKLKKLIKSCFSKKLKKK